MGGIYILLTPAPIIDHLCGSKPPYMANGVYVLSYIECSAIEKKKLENIFEEAIQDHFKDKRSIRKGVKEEKRYIGCTFT